MPRAAQHRRLPHGQGGDHHGADGARAVRHAIGSSSRSSPTTTRCSPTCSVLSRPRGVLSRDGFKVLPLYHRGFERRRAAGRRGLPRADALGGADRLGARPHQPVCAPKTLRAYFPDTPLIVDAGHRRAVSRGAGDGDGLRRRAAQHGGRQGRRSGGDGGGLRAAPSRRAGSAYGPG